MKDERLLYVALAAIGGFMGLAISISQPVTGFFITGSTITLAILGLMVDFKNSFSDKLPSLGNRTIEENRTSAIVGVLTLASFVPLLYPEVLIAISLLLFLAAGLIYYLIRQGSGNTESTVEDAAKLVMVGVIFLTAAQIPFLLVIPPGFMFSWFLWSLLPKSKQRELMESV